MDARGHPSLKFRYQPELCRQAASVPPQRPEKRHSRYELRRQCFAVTCRGCRLIDSPKSERRCLDPFDRHPFLHLRVVYLKADDK